MSRRASDRAELDAQTSLLAIITRTKRVTFLVLKKKPDRNLPPSLRDRGGTMKAQGAARLEEEALKQRGTIGWDAYGIGFSWQCPAQFGKRSG